jgi:hypothetical protein
MMVALSWRILDPCDDTELGSGSAVCDSLDEALRLVGELVNDSAPLGRYVTFDAQAAE